MAQCASCQMCGNVVFGDVPKDRTIICTGCARTLPPALYHAMLAKAGAHCYQAALTSGDVVEFAYARPGSREFATLCEVQFLAVGPNAKAFYAELSVRIGAINWMAKLADPDRLS
jgi:hypothetical protein